MSPAARRLVRTMRSLRLVDPGDRIAVAVSGGADSVALWWLLLEAEAAMPPSRAFTVAGLVHVHHGLRGDEADRDEDFCRALAVRAGREIEVGRFDVAARARETRRSLEATGREIRLAFFEVAARRLDARKVATAHTLDDQAETVLLRLLRGAGRRGVAGIRPAWGILIRPLIESRRGDLRRYLADRGETWCEDRSNSDLTVPRNRIRHEILPPIERAWPSAVPAIARFASAAADDERYLELQAIQAAGSLVSWERGCARIERAGLAALPVGVARRVIRAVLERLSPTQKPGFLAIDAVFRAAAADSPVGRLNVRGAFVEWTGDTVNVRAPASPPAEALSEIEFDVPARVQLEAAGLVLTAREARRDDLPDEAAGRGPGNGRGRSVLVPRDVVTLPFRVRGRRAGDRLRPLGSPGRRKVHDLLIDRKVPRTERDRVPVVTDATGRIVWVVGHALAEECRWRGPDSAVTGMVLLETDVLR